jgi:hypothetical protein
LAGDLRQIREERTVLGHIKAYVDAILNTIGQGITVLIDNSGRQASEIHPVPARAQRRIYQRLETEARTRRMGEPDPMDTGCIVYHRPKRTIGGR